MKIETGPASGPTRRALRSGRAVRVACAPWPALLLSLLAAAATAQQVDVQVARGPYYVGEAFEVQVVAQHFEEEPEPEVDVGAVGGGRLRFVGVSPSTSTSISIVNGKMTRTREVKFVYRYAFTGTREGRVLSRNNPSTPSSM